MEFGYYIRSYQILIISLIITFHYPNIFLDYYFPYIYKRNISINLYKNHSIFYIQKKQKDSFSNNDKIKKNPLPFKLGNLEKERWKEEIPAGVGSRVRNLERSSPPRDRGVTETRGPDDRGTKGGPAGFLRVAQCFSKFRAILLSTASGSSFGSSHRVYRVYHSRPCPPPDNFDNSIVVSVRARGSTKRGEKYMNTTLKLELCDFVSKWRPSQTSIRG